MLYCDYKVSIWMKNYILFYKDETVRICYMPAGRLFQYFVYWYIIKSLFIDVRAKDTKKFILQLHYTVCKFTTCLVQNKNQYCSTDEIPCSTARDYYLWAGVTVPETCEKILLNWPLTICDSCSWLMTMTMRFDSRMMFFNCLEPLSRMISKLLEDLRTFEKLLEDSRTF